MPGPDSDGEEEIDPPPLITVDNFISEQYTLPARTRAGKRRQVKYSRKTNKITNELVTPSTPDTDLYDTVPSSSSPRFGANRRTRRQRKSKKKGPKSFSERLRTAAILSHVDVAMTDSDMTGELNPVIVPLVTGPFNINDNTPSSPLPPKRVTYTDARTPRRIDDGFADKENVGSIRKRVRPLSHWDPQALRLTLTDALTNSDSPGLGTMPIHSNHNEDISRRTNLTPLKLVSYKEHSASLLAKFVP